jgi:hypothetical protein
MRFKRRLEKLEKTAGSLPCSICHNWWQGPLVIRNEWEPALPCDPDRCPKCGRQPPFEFIQELIIVSQTDPPRPFVERV